MKQIYSFLFLILSCSAALGDSAIEQGFQSGLRLYQEGKFEEASIKFKLDYDTKPETAALLFNWGLASYKQNQKGLALALWRRALYADPELGPAKRAIDFLRDEMPGDVFLPNSRGLEKLNQSVLSLFGVHKILSLTLILLLASGFLVIRYLSHRQRALLTEQPLPKTPTTAITMTALFLFCAFLVGAKLLVLKDTRATVVTQSAVLRTGPNQQDNTLFELLEGIEVVVRRIQNSSVLVSLPEGASGWVSSADLFQHTGQERLW